jgi:uncharacterized protein YcfJ
MLLLLLLEGRETAEFVGSLIGGFFGVLGGGGWGSAILGAIGSKYGGDIAEEIYDYFTNSVLAIFRLLVHIKTNPL